MTRRVVYAAALVAFLATLATTIASISIPRWISWDEAMPDGTPIHFTYGLHERCSSVSGLCETFPTDEECREDRDFCSMWRSIGFLMSFAVVLEGMTVIAFIVLLASGVQQRISGRSIICGFLLLIAVVQAACMGLIEYLYEHHDRFFPGFHLDSSWILCTSSWVIAVLTAGGILLVSNLLPAEGDYELIPDRS